ncbi:MAG TPA: S-layer homology domain-containing protein [Acidimicrobiia bacterium]|nr:S-layer homology domain-containing protein [Acidimicrobiia bacterium]
MVASLMVIGAAPASAAIVDTSGSCPASIPAAGFTDIGALDATTQHAINCLAFYDITKGTSATTFSPNGQVERWQMALFLARQAVAHGITMPSGAHQGFNDIAGLNAETQTAINQLAQLDITKGTSATTFDPSGIVTRWQMALFLTRLVTADGIALPSGAPQGYTDLGGLSAEAVLAINQVTQLGIAEGIGGGQFAPFANTLRWQMALFLTRTLAVGNVQPTALRVTITPSDAVTLGSGQARTYTATFRNADGSAYTAQVGIRILDVSNGAPVYNTVADGNTEFEAGTDGIVAGTELFVGFPGPNGAVTFTIRNTVAENVVVLAWQDTNGDGGYGNALPTEPFAVTAVQTFSAVAAPAATSGSTVGMVVASTIKANNTFAAGVAGQNCGNGLGANCTFTYDANDIFQIGAVAATLADFEAALSAADVINITYFAAADGQSTFNITTDNVAPLTVTAPSAAVTVDAATFTITGRADPGASVRVHVDLNNDGDGTGAGEGVVQTVTASEDGAYSAQVSLTQNAANNFVVRQLPVDGVLSAFVNVPTITEGPNVAAKISSTTGANAGTGGILDPSDTITIVFDEAVTGVGANDTISIADQDGSIATLTCGGNVTCSLSGDGLTLTLVVQSLIFATGGTTAGIQIPAQITAVSGFQGADGLAINVAGSAGGAIFGGF